MEYRVERSKPLATRLLPFASCLLPSAKRCMLLPTLPSSSAIAVAIEIEVIILVDSVTEDTTEYLFSTQANKKQLLEAMGRVEKEEGLVVITEQEWHEKYSI